MLEYYCYVVFIFFSFLVHLSYNYKMLTLEDPSLCSPLVKRHVKLGTESQSALIVTMNSLKDHSLDWDKNFFCKFQLEAPKHNKIFAVIQNMAFRRHAVTLDCIDHIHMKRADGSTSPQYCGIINATKEMDTRFVLEDNVLGIASNSFVDFTGQLDVNVYIAKEALATDEFMDLKIVFTAYKSCSFSLPDYQNCSKGYHQNCIYKGFIKDGEINCPYYDCTDEGGCYSKTLIDSYNAPRDNCTDESGCYNKTLIDSYNVPMDKRVIISSVSVLLVAFVIFVCFVWFCRRYQKLCWSEQFSGAYVGSLRPPFTIEMDEQAMPECIETTLGSIAAVEEDKDLPPSYSSLFPNQ